MIRKVYIGEKMVGDDQPCYIIAEIGSNHNQDWDLAIKTIDAAIDAGADAVKFQTFRAAEHVSKFARMPSYLMEGSSIQDLLKTLEIDRSWHKPLKEYCNKKGIDFFSSPCDFDAVDELAELGVPAMKVASFDLTDLRLIRHIAEKKAPIILSTGLADWMDIQRAVDACHEVGNHDVILLQCTSLYPAPIEMSNLKAMSSMRKAFGLPTGYSDHTLGDTVPCAAVALGACMIEKHFTLDKTLPGPDHSFAMEPGELKSMIGKIRDIESAMGDGVKNGPRGLEIEMAEKIRRSIHAARDIEAGEIITEEMLTIKRPGLGIQPYLLSSLIGRKAGLKIPADHHITWNML